jgi:hypothetical protein
MPSTSIIAILSPRLPFSTVTSSRALVFCTGVTRKLGMPQPVAVRRSRVSRGMVVRIGSPFSFQQKMRMEDG